jgi:hypothetical protein
VAVVINPKPRLYKALAVYLALFYTNLGSMPIISLPSGLFYGTGIPACVLVVNKSKPDELQDKILFVNADRKL